MPTSQKRKAVTNTDQRPSKKQQISTGPTKVELVTSGSNVIKPIVATTPGAAFPAEVKFTSYVRKADKNDIGDKHSTSQILLHSSDHPTIDYTAVEGADPNEAHVKHYVGVYDPATATVKLVEAKWLSMRGSIRQAITHDEEPDDEDPPVASQGTRAALTEAFGSKKSKKAVQAMAENRQLGQGGEGATIAEAITSHVKADDEDDDQAAAAVMARSNKPLPVPDLETDDIHQVYDLRSLISPKPSRATLEQMPVGEWQSRLKAGKEITGLRSRFIANRISYLGKQLILAQEPHLAKKYVEQLQLLRYIALLLEVATYTSKQDRRRKLEPAEKWPAGTVSADTPINIVKQAVRHLFPEGTASERASTLLRTTILALSLHVLPPSGNWGTNQLATEPTDIQLDLAMKGDEIRKLYHELGCRLGGASDKDLSIWGLSKLAKKGKSEDGTKLAKPVFAVLKFPLDFPRVSGGRKVKR